MKKKPGLIDIIQIQTIKLMTLFHTKFISWKLIRLINFKLNMFNCTMFTETDGTYSRVLHRLWVPCLVMADTLITSLPLSMPPDRLKSSLRIYRRGYLRRKAEVKPKSLLIQSWSRRGDGIMMSKKGAKSENRFWRYICNNRIL